MVWVDLTFESICYDSVPVETTLQQEQSTPLGYEKWMYFNSMFTRHSYSDSHGAFSSWSVCYRVAGSSIAAKLEPIPEKPEL